MIKTASPFLVRKTAAQPLARALALVALLCVGALQAQEASHGHWYEQDDSSVQCLVCKNSVGAALPLEVNAVSPLGVVAGASQLLTQTPTDAGVSPFLARGPPSYS